MRESYGDYSWGSWRRRRPSGLLPAGAEASWRIPAPTGGYPYVPGTGGYPYMPGVVDAAPPPPPPLDATPNSANFCMASAPGGCEVVCVPFTPDGDGEFARRSERSSPRGKVELPRIPSCAESCAAARARVRVARKAAAERIVRESSYEPSAALVAIAGVPRSLVARRFAVAMVERLWS